MPQANVERRPDTKSAATLFAVATAVVVAVGLTVDAEAVAAQAAARTEGFCFRGRPLPDCRVSALVEASVLGRFAGRDPLGIDSDRWEATWELGALLNQEDGNAWGGTFLIGTGEYRPRVGVRLRYRRWLDENWTADLAAGPLTHSTSVGSWGMGGSADVGIGYRDYAGLFARVEVLPAEGEGTSTAGFIGARLGSWPALAGSAFAAVVFVIALANADFQ